MKVHPSKQLETLDEVRSIEEHIRKFCDGEIKLNRRLNEIMMDKDISLTEMMRNSCINRNYGYNIVNGKRENPGRDKVIALCIAAKLSVEETQDLLAVAKVGALYYRRERDVRIAGALNKKIGNVLEVNIMLSDCGLEPLDV